MLAVHILRAMAQGPSQGKPPDSTSKTRRIFTAIFRGLCATVIWTLFLCIIGVSVISELAIGLFLLTVTNFRRLVKRLSILRGPRGTA